MKDEKEVKERLELLNKIDWGIPGLFDKGYYRYKSALEWVLDKEK